jgi:hypothetical protein
MKYLRDLHRPSRRSYLLSLNLCVLLIAISGFGAGVNLINLLHQIWRGAEFDSLVVFSAGVGVFAPVLMIFLCIFSINRIVHRLAAPSLNLSSVSK